MKQTAVQILLKKISSEVDYIPLNIWPKLSVIVDQALALEKQQIIDSFETAFNEAYKLPLDRNFNTSGQYYLETYKNETE